jgi:hypothetical protein
VVVERAVRLVERNRERFVKSIRPGPKSTGRLILARDGGDETARIRAAMARWPDDGGTRAVLARTNIELLPAAAAAVEDGIAFRAPKLRLLTEDRRVDAILAACAGDAAETPPDSPLLACLAALARNGVTLPEPEPRGVADRDAVEEEPLPIETADLVAAMVGWAAPYRSLPEFGEAIERHRARVAELRREDASLTLATAHSTKGLEFDHVLVIGMDEGRFPSARSLRESAEPERALEEERRLAYVAWTRARRTLTLSYDPASPSPFLLEAFDAGELGLA